MLNLRGESRVATLEMTMAPVSPERLCCGEWVPPSRGTAAVQVVSSGNWFARRGRAKLLSTPARKNIHLFRNSDLPYSRVRSAPAQGASRDRRGRGAECGGRVGAV